MESIVCVTCGALAWLACWLVIGGSSLEASRIGARVLSAWHLLRRAVAQASGARVVYAALRWGPFSHGAKRIERWSTRLAKPLQLEEAAVLELVLLVATSLLGGLCAGSWLGAAAVAAATLGYLVAQESAQRRAARAELVHGMPGVLRTLATALGSGHTLVQAMEYVGLHEQGLVAAPFARASLRLRCGMPVESALSALEDELKAPGVDLLVTALAISQRTGSPLRELFQRSALLVEEHEERERLLAVKTAQVRLSVRIVCCLPPLMVCFLSLLSPDFQQGLSSVAGMACVALAAAMDGVALLVIRRMLEGVV